MNLRKINFPVFPLNKPVSKIGTKTLFINSADEEEILDDSSIPAATLGLRRLQIKGKLYPLKRAIYFLKDIVKLNPKQLIDNTGKIINYKKSIFVDLIFRKITNITPIPTGGALLEVENESPRYKIMYAPTPLEKYIGMLQVSPKVYIVYGLYEEKHKNTRRKI